jgi:hypothetical protein
MPGLPLDGKNDSLTEDEIAALVRLEIISKPKDGEQPAPNELGICELHVIRQLVRHVDELQRRVEDLGSKLT